MKIQKRFRYEAITVSATIFFPIKYVLSKDIFELCPRMCDYNRAIFHTICASLIRNFHVTILHVGPSKDFAKEVLKNLTHSAHSSTTIFLNSLTYDAYQQLINQVR